jgi:hypothetical protein
MFFDAMITSSVPARKAKLLYAGVYLGGPRWSKTVVENTRLATAYRSPDRYRSSDGGSTHRAKFALKNSTSIVRTTKTVTLLRKYPLRDTDLDWLNDQIEDSPQSLKAIERMVDIRLAARTPRERII